MVGAALLGALELLVAAPAAVDAFEAALEALAVAEVFAPDALEDAELPTAEEL